MESSLHFTSTAIHQTNSYGTFNIDVYENRKSNQEHIVLSKGLNLNTTIYCRFFSECTTGIVLDSCTCDCKEQLDYTLDFFSKVDSAILIFLREEGRGHGLTLKIRALENKNKGLDTFAAVEALGVSPDIRTHLDAIEILQHKGIRSIHLFTNNPDKILAVKNNNIEIKSIINIPITNSEHYKIHIDAKIKHGHNIKFE